jgi:hypothetical protein
MTKREAKNLKPGDRVQQKHTVWKYTVLGEEPFYKFKGTPAKVPIFKCQRDGDNSIHEITYLLLVRIDHTRVVS